MQGFSRGEFCSVQDFGLAYEHERRVKHQSLWFSEIQSTLYGICVRVHLLDVADSYISAEKKAKLLEHFQHFQEPAIITISIGVLSPDHTQDNAFVQHANKLLLAFMHFIAAPGVKFKVHHQESTPLVKNDP